MAATVQGVFLGVEGAVSGRLVAVESYAGCVPTFTWMSESGHVFCFLPPHAFGPPGTTLASCVDQECPPGAIDVSDLGLEGPGHARLGDAVVPWKRYVATVDWYEQNRLCHVVQASSGQLCFVRNPRFQVGGEKYDPPSWKKMREVWTLRGT